jgi:hypothetical protein
MEEIETYQPGGLRGDGDSGGVLRYHPFLSSHFCCVGYDWKIAKKSGNHGVVCAKNEAWSILKGRVPVIAINK